MFQIQSPKTKQAQVKMVTTLEQMQVPIGTGSGVRRSKRPVLTSRIRCNAIWKPPKFCNKVKFGNKIQVGNKLAYFVMSDQLRVSLYMVQNVTYTGGGG